MLDARESFGGTWLTHRYPGIRSDSDLYTFGYRFKPWTSHPIVSGSLSPPCIARFERQDASRHVHNGSHIWSTI